MKSATHPFTHLTATAVLLAHFPLLPLAQHQHHQPEAAAAVSASSSFDNNVPIPSFCDSSHGFGARSDGILITFPYPYDATLPLISDFGNLTWANISSVTLNGTDNVAGTARSFDFGGAKFYQKLLDYDNPQGDESGRVFVEVHNSAPVVLGIPPPMLLQMQQQQQQQKGKGSGSGSGSGGSGGSANLTIWSDRLRLELQSACDGRASQVNWTWNLCSDQPDVAKGMLHVVHTGFVENVGRMLGGGDFTGCEGLGGAGGGMGMGMGMGMSGGVKGQGEGEGEKGKAGGEGKEGGQGGEEGCEEEQKPPVSYGQPPPTYQK